MEREFLHKRNKGACIGTPQGTVDILVDRIFRASDRLHGVFEILQKDPIKGPWIKRITVREFHTRHVTSYIDLRVRESAAGSVVPVHYNMHPACELTLEARSIYFQDNHTGVSISTTNDPTLSLDPLDILFLHMRGENSYREAHFAVRQGSSYREVHASWKDGLVEIAPGIRLMLRTVPSENLPMLYLTHEPLHLAWVTYDPHTLKTTPVSP
jgi:hypothetical protein